MDPGALIRDVRLRGGFTQAELAQRSATSQATLSAYERGHKAPSASTLGRVLAAAGYRLTATRAERAVLTPSADAHELVARTLGDVLALAAALPVRHDADLRFPPLRPSVEAAA